VGNTQIERDLTQAAADVAGHYADVIRAGHFRSSTRHTNPLVTTD
jgi:hypothetical protein